MMQTITGFHAIEEILKAEEKQLLQPSKQQSKTQQSDIHIYYAKIGPRVKQILEHAQKLSIPYTKAAVQDLDAAVKMMPEKARDHRGIILTRTIPDQKQTVTFDELLVTMSDKKEALIIILDSITDPHNIGAIIRSADQFAADAIIIPDRRSAGDFETISRISAGAAAWVPLVMTPNLVRAAEQLKHEGFWIFGADANGASLSTISFPEKTVLIMGSEGTGIAPLLKKNCDTIVSIPTAGKLDSLNVSVAAGILLYEVRRKESC